MSLRDSAITVTLDEAAKTVAKASWGRFYGKLLGNMFRNASNGNTSLNAFFFNPDTGAYDIPYYSVDPNISYGIDPDLDEPVHRPVLCGPRAGSACPTWVSRSPTSTKQEKNFMRVDDVRGEYAQIPFEDTFRGQTPDASGLQSDFPELAEPLPGDEPRRLRSQLRFLHRAGLQAVLAELAAPGLVSMAEG